MDTPKSLVPFPQTAEQHNAPLVGSVVLTSDQIRSKLVETFEVFKPHLQGYHEYAERSLALSLEYHKARFAEALPGVPVEEQTLAASLDARETPTSLDTKLDQMRSLPIKRIVFDRVHSTYHLFV